MSQKDKSYEEQVEQQVLYDHYHQSHMKHWRAWGSWFSWGSPVGLGLFFISIAFTLWILAQAFGWK